MLTDLSYVGEIPFKGQWYPGKQTPLVDGATWDLVQAVLGDKVFELSQTLQSTWVSADYATKRRILEIVCLNCTLEGAGAVFTTRKPFDVLIEGLYSEQSRGDRI